MWIKCGVKSSTSIEYGRSPGLSDNICPVVVVVGVVVVVVSEKVVKVTGGAR